MKAIHLFIPAIATMLVWSSAFGSSANDTLRLALPSAEVYLQQRAALALTDAQTATVESAIATMIRESHEMTPQLEARNRELVAAVENASTSAEEVQGKLEAVFEVENRLKAARLRANLAARRAVTSEQWKKLGELLVAAASTEPTRDDLREKVQRMRELTRELFPDGLPVELRRLYSEAQNETRAGQTAGAARLFDQIIAEMESRRAATLPKTR
ncbi:MAG: hypothetical protein R3F13_05505 [Prosthecobacter sp.]